MELHGDDLAAVVKRLRRAEVQLSRSPFTVTPMAP